MIQIAALITIFIIYVIPLNMPIYTFFNESGFLYLLVVIAILIVVYITIYILDRMKYIKYNGKIRLSIQLYNKCQMKINIIGSSIVILLLVLQGVFFVADIRIYTLGILLIICLFSSNDYNIKMIKAKSNKKELSESLDFDNNDEISYVDDSKIREEETDKSICNNEIKLEEIKLEKNEDREAGYEEINDKEINGESQVNVRIEEKRFVDEAVISDELERYFENKKDYDENGL